MRCFFIPVVSPLLLMLVQNLPVKLVAGISDYKVQPLKKGKLNKSMTSFV